MLYSKQVVPRLRALGVGAEELERLVRVRVRVRVRIRVS